ncbi:MAG: hypothetical protein ACM3TT_14245, partial [Syntrophothermus sp.]
NGQILVNYSPLIQGFQPKTRKAPASFFWHIADLAFFGPYLYHSRPSLDAAASMPPVKRTAHVLFSEDAPVNLTK